MCNETMKVLIGGKTKYVYFVRSRNKTVQYRKNGREMYEVVTTVLNTDRRQIQIDDSFKFDDRIEIDDSKVTSSVSQFLRLS